MVDNSILRKVKACLARSESSNPNEAAIALRQAHALMQKHSINVDSVEEMLNMVDISTTQKRRRLEGFAKQFDVQLATKVMSNNKVTTSDRLKGFEEGLEATLFHAATYNLAKNNIGGNSYYLGH